MDGTERQLQACPDCGLIQTVPPLSPGTIAECLRCAHRLAYVQPGGLEFSVALATSALLLLFPAAVLPLLRLSSFGTTRLDRLPSGVEALWHDGYAPLATAVFLFSLAIPMLYLCLHVGVLWALRMGLPWRLGRLFRWAGQLRPWAMIEVFLVGACVAYSRLEAIGPVSIDTGGWCLLGAAITTASAIVDPSLVLADRVAPDVHHLVSQGDGEDVVRQHVRHPGLPASPLRVDVTNWRHSASVRRPKSGVNRARLGRRAALLVAFHPGPCARIGLIYIEIRQRGLVDRWALRSTTLVPPGRNLALGSRLV